MESEKLKKLPLIQDIETKKVLKKLASAHRALAELKGKVIMLQFTASWCSVCRQEMPYIEKDIGQYKCRSDIFRNGRR